jgi:hypothetical protein
LAASVAVDRYLVKSPGHLIVGSPAELGRDEFVESLAVWLDPARF